MVGIVVASHGRLAQALVDAAFMILGKQPQVEAVGLEPGHGLSDMREELERAVERVDTGDGFLIMADLRGGTPCNAGGLLVNRPGFHLVTGANLAMLLEVLLNRHSASADRLADLAVLAGRSGVDNVGAQLKTTICETQQR